MKIGLIGYGKMGREIEVVAREQGETIAEIFDIDRPADLAALANVDVCIEFSTPETALTNIRLAIAAGKDIVVGTTGWYDHLPEIQKEIRHSGLLYSPNFSIGVNVFFRIVAKAAELMNNAAGYDAYIHEIHHRQKMDSPSGTALKLAQLVVSRLDRKSLVETRRIDGRIDPHALHVTSSRVGTFAGTHTVGFDSDADLIELQHVAKNRKGFAQGAVRAAQWLHGKKGVFTMDDVEL